jgi:hypothetical protein
MPRRVERKRNLTIFRQFEIAVARVSAERRPSRDSEFIRADPAALRDREKRSA